MMPTPQTPPSLMARVAQRLRAATSIAGAWFGPLDPLPAQAPPEVAGRQWDYPNGYNLVTEPRAFERISFHELRGLAENYDLLRLVIETRKDQLAAQSWKIVPRDESKKADADPQIQEITEFLAYPDREHDWNTWLRMLVEDLLVIDAPTIYPRWTNGGQIYALDLIDGATIKRVLDENGRTPMPPYPAYQQFLKGVPAVDYTAEEIIYLPRNQRTNRPFGYSPVEQIVMTVNIALRRQINQLQYYSEGNVPEALAGVPLSWSVAQISEFQQYWDSILEGNTAVRRHMKFVPGEIAKNYVPTKEPALKDEYDEWLARIVCYAFSVSSQWAVKQMNRATAETAQDQAATEGLGPLLAWIKGVVDRLLAKVWKRPDLQLSWREEQEPDPKTQAETTDIYLKNGTMTLNDSRATVGLPPIGPLGDVHRIYTATGAIPLDQVDAPPAPPPMLGHNGGPPLDDGGGGGGDDAGGGDDQEGDRGSSSEVEKLAKAAGNRIDRNRPAIMRGRTAMEAIWRTFLILEGKRAAKILSARFGGLAKADDQDQAPPAPGDDEAGAAAIAAGTEPAATDTVPADAIEAAIDAVLADVPWEEIEAESESTIQDAAVDGVGEGLAVIGNGQDLDMVRLANPRAVAWAAEHAAELVSGIENTTRDGLRSLIVQAEQNGWSVAQLRDAIVNAYAFSAERAATIAQHELAAADIQGNLIGWMVAQDELGLSIEKRTILGINENHCAACQANVRAGAIPLNEPFPSGQLASPFHPHCGCDLVPVTAQAPVEKATSSTLQKGFDPDEARDDHGRWSAEGAIAQGQQAMDHVIQHHADVHGAMERPGLGKVSFIWGQAGDPAKGHRDGWGIAKIIAKRSGEGHDGDAVARKMPEVIAKGTEVARTRSDNRMQLVHEGHTAILSRDAETWLLTGWKNDRSR
jgi:hypothetical protein